MANHKSERFEFITSTVGSLLLAHFYALIEHWLNWSEVHKYFSIFPSWRGITAYHYIFMFSLFLLIGGLPFMDDLITSEHRKYIPPAVLWTIGNALLTGLVEDAAYFYLFNTWIKPTNWTAKILGYVIVFEIVIPIWYFTSTILIITIYYAALKLMR